MMLERSFVLLERAGAVAVLILGNLSFEMETRLML